MSLGPAFPARLVVLTPRFRQVHLMIQQRHAAGGHSDHAELVNLACKTALLERDVAHLVFPDEVQNLPAGPGQKAGSPVGRVADRCIQVHGGNGFMTELGIEAWYRDVRAMRLYEGTTEILRTNVAKTLGL